MDYSGDDGFHDGFLVHRALGCKHEFKSIARYGFVMDAEAGKTQVVLAVGGEAKRMGLDIPKALIPLNGSTLLDRCMDMFLGSGFREFVFLLGYEDKKITEYLDRFDFRGAKITKSYDYAKGIAKGKAVKYALENGKIDANKRSVFAWPDDIFLQNDLPKTVLAAHMEASRRFGTIASEVVASAFRLPAGVVNVDERGVVTSFEEQPLIPIRASTGMRIFDPAAYSYFIDLIDLNKPGPIEFEKVVMPILAAKRKVYAIPIPPDSWLQINTQKELEQAKKMID